MSAKQRRWLESALATDAGDTHPDLGKYVEQVEGRTGFLIDLCERCGRPPTEKGHDPCLANLPGVDNACCGHGEAFAYAILWNGFCLTGRALRVYLDKMGYLERFQYLAGERAWYRRKEWDF